MLLDRFGHQISYLRISVTDRCNLRCVYCMPEEGILKQPHHAMLRYEEITEVVRVFASYGVQAVRLTGGEPLVRPELYRLVEMLAGVPGIEDISLTTNALLLEKQAADLAQAGLKRVNISLDTLKREKFLRISRFDRLEDVWRGIEAAEKAGLSPIKINVVTMRGVNDDELLDLALLTTKHRWTVRFIELMPIGNQVVWGDWFPSPEEAYISTAETKGLLSSLGLVPVKKSVGSGPAREYRVPGSPGRIGFISPISQHFCLTCNRLRLTADGNLRPCLLNDLEIPLLPAIRAGQPIQTLIEEALALKPARHHLDEDQLPEKRKMKEIGG